ncbi:MAG: hypothetical protein RSF67_07370 [Clostridia bacterium]
MKVCRKCQIEYKDDYAYCPRCGTPYDNKVKKVEVQEEVNGSIMDITKKIWNILGYILGSLLILTHIITIGKHPGKSILVILFGLSLFQIFYKLISNKFVTINEKHLTLYRILLPITILVLLMIFFPIS